METILLYEKYEEAQNSLFTVQQQEKEERPDVEDLTWKYYSELGYIDPSRTYANHTIV